MNDKTSSGEPTFGLAKFTTAKVESASGMVYVAYHDGETWYEGHYDETAAGGCKDGRAQVQIAEAPVRLVA